MPDPREVRILPIEYAEAESFWKTHLWPDRPESWRPVSTMLFEGGFDMRIRDDFKPVFWGAFAGDRLIGVNSGHFSAPGDFRSRGLCVLPEFRGRGVGSLLLGETLAHAGKLGVRRVWSYPRLASWAVYAKTGFQKTPRRLREGDENCYASVEMANA